MAQFDVQQADPQQAQFQRDQARIAFLEQNVNYLTSSIQQLQTHVLAPVQQQISHPNLNLP